MNRTLLAAVAAFVPLGVGVNLFQIQHQGMGRVR